MYVRRNDIYPQWSEPSRPSLNPCRICFQNNGFMILRWGSLSLFQAILVSIISSLVFLIPLSQTNVVSLYSHAPSEAESLSESPVRDLPIDDIVFVKALVSLVSVLIKSVNIAEQGFNLPQSKPVKSLYTNIPFNFKRNTII